MIELRRGDRVLPVTFVEWTCELCLAIQDSWTPRGTSFNPAGVRAMFLAEGESAAAVDEVVEEFADEWRVNYLFNDQQLVSDADAAELADALSHVAAEVPADDVPLEPWPRLRLPLGEVLNLCDFRGPMLSPYQPFVGDAGRAQLAAIIDFCRDGEFAIT